MNLDKFFYAKDVAVVGVSQNPNKVGHVIFRNFFDSGFKGKVYPINNKINEILGVKTYSSITKIKAKIDLAIIAVPAKYVIDVVKQCAEKKIKDVVIVTAGFSEIGDKDLEDELRFLLNKYKIKCIGVNCLGVLDTYTELDTLFLPKSRLKRPGKGGISFVCQSGAVGSAILDLAAKEGYGFSKFISYGNATNVDESDLIEYLGNDKNTKVICLYVEAIKDGKKFMEVAKKVSKKKPIIAIKGGLSEKASHATLSHTGSLAGKAEIYLAAFKQCKVINADSLQDMFNYARILEKSIPPKGDRVQIITNGGGYGILATDDVLENDLELAELSKETIKDLRKQFPDLVTVGNPMDLVGDATTERYKVAINASLNDPNVDIILIILLMQTPLITTDIIDVITEFNSLKKKPIAVISTGGDFTEILKSTLEGNNVPTFVFPVNAVKAIKQLVEYHKKK